MCNSSTLRACLCWLLLVSAGVSAQNAPGFLHYKPHDHALGDVHPFFQDGECYLYYLKPGKYDSALVRSRDLLNWSEAAMAHDQTSPEDWMSPYYVLGVFRDPSVDVYRSFYGHAQGRMASSESSDLLHWSCAPKEYHVPSASYYERRRDPFVFWIPEMKQYGCVMTTWTKGRAKDKGGAVSLALSPDLKHWTDHGPILDPGNIGEPECPQMFHLGKRWYLLASIYDRAVGAPVYWVADQVLGPWAGAPAGGLDGKDLCAAQVAFDGETPVLFGWVPLTAAKLGKQSWGGHLALPREVYHRDDGGLGTRLPAKIDAAFVQLPWRQVQDSALGTKPHAVEGPWQKLAVEFTLRMSVAGGEVRVTFGQLGDVVVTPAKLQIRDANGECWSELPVRLQANQAIRVRLFVDRDIIELFVDERYSLAARLPKTGDLTRLTLEWTGQGQTEVSGFRTTEWRLPR